MDYCITVRAPAGNGFGSDPGPTSFLAVPDGATDFNPGQAVGPADWVRGVLAGMAPVRDPSGAARRDLLVFVHGYDNKPPIVLQRQRALRKGLQDAGFHGSVISFDWPSDEIALSYLNDRNKAKQTAYTLVTDCIELFLRTQAVTECDVNVHILAHSTGAYVVREAFDDADDRSFHASLNWTVSQMVFIGADISASSLSQGNPETDSIYRHCIRLTNYANPWDDVLQLSNLKRAGAAPRVGRVGLPGDCPPKAVNVDCGEYYQTMIKTRDPHTIIGWPSHSWHVNDPVFTADLAVTLNGAVDRRAIRTRKQLPTGQFELVPPAALVATGAVTPVPVVTANPAAT